MNPQGKANLFNNFVFPEGIIYDTKNEAVLTTKPNPFFEKIASLQTVLGDNTNDKGSTNAALSCFVGWTGFEPATPCTPCKYATGLRHHPKKYRVYFN
jgi:hypothetical protein